MRINRATRFRLQVSPASQQILPNPEAAHHPVALLMQQPNHFAEALVVLRASTRSPATPIVVPAGGDL